MKKTTYIILGLIAASFVVYTVFILFYFTTEAKRLTNNLVMSHDLCHVNEMPAFNAVELSLADAIRISAKDNISDQDMLDGFKIIHSDGYSLSYSQSWGDNLTWAVADSVLKITISCQEGYEKVYVDNFNLVITMPKIDAATLTSGDSGFTTVIDGFVQDSLSLNSVSELEIDNSRIGKIEYNYVDNPTIKLLGSTICTFDARGEYDINVFTYDGSIDTLNWHATQGHAYSTMLYKAVVNHFNWIPEHEAATLQFHTNHQIHIDIDQQ